MKKQVGFILFFALFAVMVQAQDIKFGVRLGLSTNQIKGEDLIIKNAKDIKQFQMSVADAKYGYHGGAFVRLGLTGRLFVQPEVLFNSSSVEYNLKDLTKPSMVQTVGKESYQNIDIPVLVGLKLGAIHLQAGPVGHVFISSKSDIPTTGTEYVQKFKSLTYSYQVGAGLDVGSLLFDVKYESDLSKFGDHFTFYGRNFPFSTNASRVVFSLGYAF
jgi:Outer membrane protein beta-barrel domain